MAGFRRLFRLTGREPSPAEDVRAEFEAHLALKIEALVRGGLSPGEARAEAERRFGSLERFAAECKAIDLADRRERRRAEWWLGALQDLRLAARSLVRSPGFALTAVAVLATGIGLNVSVFAGFRGIVLDPLPYPRSDRLVAVYSSNPPAGWPEFSVSPADFLDFESGARTFQAMVAWSTGEVAATGDGPAESVPVSDVTAGFQRVAGVAPIMGRGFAPGDFGRGAPAVVLLSHPVWVTRFGRNPGVVGNGWMLDGVRHEIIGVMPEGFEFPIGRTAAWRPLRMPENAASQRGAHYLEVAGRLTDGGTLEAARAELGTMAARIARDFPRSSAGWGVLLRPLHESVVQDARPTLLLLLTGVGLLLALACINVASLILVRALARRGEAAVRSALGATRGRLLWHSAGEVLVLVAAGALVAIPVAAFGVASIRRMAPAGVPRIGMVRLDGWMLLAGTALAALVAVAVGLAPARMLRDNDLRGSLTASRSVGSRRRLHDWLVTLETGVALALLAVAGVLTHSMQRLSQVDPGFDPRATLVADLSMPGSRYPDSEALLRFQGELLRRVRAVPGAESAALVFGLPLSDFGYSSSFTIDSVPVPDDENQSAQLRIASADYFGLQHIPVVQGRGFSPEDRKGARRVVLVSAAAAKRFWPTGRPLGHWIRMSAHPDDDRGEGEIIGVVGDVRERDLASEPRPIFYFPAEQMAVSYTTLMVRTRNAPLAAAPEVRRILAELDPELPLAGVSTMEDVVRSAVAPQRFRSRLMGFFALLATALAALGVYGVLAHVVAQRSREMGLRRALGASNAQVMRSVVARGMLDATIGVGLGLGLAYLITRKLAALLYEVQPADPASFALAAGLFLSLALAAAWIPALRASRSDPLVVLRGE